eukprot:TRINITY_DN1502_c0_g1_i1.p1 TRINITY_DN1502_c0_g1~~TRINITY_DN1502_c0_g1_i1.p1  ORF type:complete len:368 (-),score=82.67 TRINITY_DN1502_c0_g1_i1:1726-2829(-)
MVAPSRMSQQAKSCLETPSSLQMAPSDEHSDSKGASNDFPWPACAPSSEPPSSTQAHAGRDSTDTPLSAASGRNPEPDNVQSQKSESATREPTQSLEKGSVIRNSEHGTSIVARLECGSPSHGLMDEQSTFDNLVLKETGETFADREGSEVILQGTVSLPPLMEFPTSAKDLSVGEGPSELLQKWKSCGVEEKEGSELVDEEEAAMLAMILKNAQRKKDAFMKERDREDREKAAKEKEKEEERSKPPVGRSSSSSLRKNGVRLEDTPVPQCWWKKPPSSPHSRPDPNSTQVKVNQPSQVATAQPASTNQKAPGAVAGAPAPPRMSSFRTAGPNPEPKPSPLPQIPTDPEAALRVLSKMGNRDPSKSL